MGEEILIEISLSSLLVLCVLCGLPYLISFIANIYWILTEIKYINAFKSIIARPDQALEIATKMIKKNDNP